MKSLITDFLKYINKKDFEAAESLFASDIFDVEDQMESLTDDDYKVIEEHWSAVNTGPDITTPFFILQKIYDYVQFKDNSYIVDLGSGHGYPGIFFGALNPSLRITGFDIVLEKVNGANQSVRKLNLNNVNYLTQDLSDEKFDIPVADYYYLYNPVNRVVADTIAHKLLKIAREKEIIILSLGGRDIKSFHTVGFTTIQGLEEIDLEILKLI